MKASHLNRNCLLNIGNLVLQYEHILYTCPLKMCNVQCATSLPGVVSRLSTLHLLDINSALETRYALHVLLYARVLHIYNYNKTI